MNIQNVLTEKIKDQNLTEFVKSKNFDGKRKNKEFLTQIVKNSEFLTKNIQIRSFKNLKRFIFDERREKYNF